MCLSCEQREEQRVKERQELTALSLQDLVKQMALMYRRAGWESPEDFSDQPNHPHVKLGWFIVELAKRAGVALEEVL